MSNGRANFFAGKIIIVLCVLLFIAACSHVPSVPPQEDLKLAYLRAVEDAKIAEPDEICRNLTAIVPSNASLRWNESTGEVLVVTWTSWDGYDDFVGNSVKLSRDVWVTVVPEVKTFCCGRHIAPKSVSLRLKQLLGLPPDDEKTKFVEMWVVPDDLFRPSPDPEISDHEAEIDFPVSDRFVTVNDTYKKWFYDLKQASYGPDGYPWTRLGYTYDWGNPESEVGLSEFVIRSGATVKINAISKTANYCR
jgi:hypothetical protein